MANFTDRQLTKAEQRAIVVDSDIEGFSVAVDRDYKGIWLLIDGQQVPIAAENIEYAREFIRETWEIYGPN